jgi:phosphatidylserine decarboxylase
VRIVPDAYRFFIPLALLAAVASYFGWHWWGGIVALLALFVLFFFRDPDRNIPADEGTFVSPADGRVVRIHNPEGEFPTQVSIFLSLFDVHVSRAPIEGKVVSMRYQKGKFKAALYEAASIDNEQSVVELENARYRVRVVLIAGLIARRIITWIDQGDSVQRGQRIGLIRFGSRVDLFLPPAAEVVVKKGDHVRGGASIIARIRKA